MQWLMLGTAPHNGSNVLANQNAASSVARVHDGPKKHVPGTNSPYVYTPYLFMITTAVYSPVLVTLIGWASVETQSDYSLSLIHI